jgi:hypothetical protein
MLLLKIQMYEVQNVVSLQINPVSPPLLLLKLLTNPKIAAIQAASVAVCVLFVDAAKYGKNIIIKVEAGILNTSWGTKKSSYDNAVSGTQCSDAGVTTSWTTIKTDFTSINTQITKIHTAFKNINDANANSNTLINNWSTACTGALTSILPFVVVVAAAAFDFNKTLSECFNIIQ